MDRDYPLAAGPPPELSGLSESPPDTEPGTPFLLPGLFLLATVLTTVIAGTSTHIQFSEQAGLHPVGLILRILFNPSLLLHGVPYSFSILTILLAHEMGHYLTCRYYGIRCTLPYVIPGVIFGTFGAVIRIRSLFRNNLELFDVGIAGPLAGFVFILPALAAGLALSEVYVIPEGGGLGIEFGEPLIFRLAVHLFFPGAPADPVSLHPLGWAAWFGVLATSLNLFPIGQTDGGHVVHALFGPRVHRIVSLATLAALVCMGLLLWLGYAMFAGMIFLLGFRHPTPRMRLALGRGRLLIGLLALLVFVLTFIPIPAQIVEFGG